MAGTRNVLRAAIALAVLCTSCGAENDDSPNATQCDAEIHCKLGRVCRNGRCAMPDKERPPSEVAVRSTNVTANWLLADPLRRRVYATVPDNADQHAGHLVALDVNGAIASSVHVGSEPTSMAISDDYTTLWVGLRRSSSIWRIDLTGDEPSPGVEYQLPPGDWGRVAGAGPMVVLPGQPDSVAVSTHEWNASPSFLGLVLLDNGVPRPARTPGHTGAAQLTGGPEGYLFGFNNQSTRFQFYSIRINERGLSQTVHNDLIYNLVRIGTVPDFHADIIYYNNRVFATNGAVVDVSDPESPRREGEFAFYGSLIPQQDGTVVMLSRPDRNLAGEGTLRLLDIATFTQLKSVTFELPGSSNAVSSFVQIEPGTYAALGSDENNWAPRVHLMSAPTLKR